ncbi:MAG: hypothetical protein DRN53_00950 [Thermoprotei archaeon]|nr:MAG: hypothetical protein DRN53_00950 [Thermoprotei archaeon]
MKLKDEVAMKVRYSLLILVLIISMLVLAVSMSKEQVEYVYYGYIPWNIYWFKPKYPHPREFEGVLIDEETVRSSAPLVIIGNHEDTHVKVFKLPLQLLEEFTLGKMEYRIVRLPNATFFKVVTSKPTTVLLMGGAPVDNWPEEPPEKWINRVTIPMFLISTEGSYVGKEFIFLATCHITPPGWDGGTFRVFALEDSEVKLYDEKGEVVASFRLKANEVKWLPLKGFRIYRLVSTGNIMACICTPRIGYPMFYPSPTGGFVGKVFYGPFADKFEPETAYRYIITSTEDTKVRLIDLDHRIKLEEIEVKGGEKVVPAKVGMNMIIESDKPIVVLMGDWFIGTGISFMGLRAGESACIYIPEGEAYLFAYRDTTVMIDGVPRKVRADEWIPLPTKGVYRISVDNTVLIQIIFYRHPPIKWLKTYWTVGWVEKLEWPLGLKAFASIIPSVQGIEITPKVTLKPLLVGGFPVWIYVAIIVVIIVLALIAWRILRR